MDARSAHAFLGSDAGSCHCPRARARACPAHRHCTRRRRVRGRPRRPSGLERSAPRFQLACKERSSCNAVLVDKARNPSMPLLKLHPLRWANGWRDQFRCAEWPAGAPRPRPFSLIFDGGVAVVRDDLPKPNPSPFQCARLSRYDASSCGSGEAMRRRDFITLFGGAAAAWPLAALAQQAGKLPTIGFLGADASAFGPWTAAFVAHLRELGWIEGRTIAIEYRWSQGRTERYAEIAAEFVRLKVDVIVTVGSAVPIVRQATAVI